MSDASAFEDLVVGRSIQPLVTNLTLHRLVLEAAANRDLTGLHHDDAAASAAGARGAFANNVFALGVWERAVRDLIGSAGVVHAIRGLRMRAFNVAGDQLLTEGRVERTWRMGELGFAELSLQTTNRTLDRITVGPGTVVVSLPVRGSVPPAPADRYAAYAHERPGPSDEADRAVAAPWDAAARMIGENLLTQPIVGADRVDRSTVRRLCEPLELADPIHHDVAAARRFGFDDIVAPVSGVGTTYPDPGSWHPGQPTQYPEASRDAALPRPPGIENGGAAAALQLPPGCVAVLTEVGLELEAAIQVGDLLGVRSIRLTCVAPKRTSIGDGAFLTFVNEVWNDADQLVARVTKVQYSYRPTA